MGCQRRLRDPIEIINIWLSGGLHWIFSWMFNFHPGLHCERSMRSMVQSMGCRRRLRNHGTWNDDFSWMSEMDVPRDRHHDIVRCHIWYSFKPHRAPIDCFHPIFFWNMNFIHDVAVIVHMRSIGRYSWMSKGIWKHSLYDHLFGFWLDVCDFHRNNTPNVHKLKHTKPESLCFYGFRKNSIRKQRSQKPVGHR